MPFKPVSKDLLFTKNDPTDQRLGEFVKQESNTALIKDSVVILGYPDDEGIHNNGGRVGAKSAPDTIRKYLYRMTPHLFSDAFSFYDLGNLNLTNLNDNHENALKSAQALVSQNNVVISLGGGHDYGYPDTAGFMEALEDSPVKPLIINLDAHLDVRPLKDKINSGTPFYRLLKKFPQKLDFLELGIQSQCNSQAHYDWLEKTGGKILDLDEILMSGELPIKKILSFLEPYILKKRPTFLSIDIDAFSNSFAPGASQSFATGFDANTVLALIDILKKRLDIRGLGIYEVSPPLDQDDKTSKLAALLVHKFIFS